MLALIATELAISTLLSLVFLVVFLLRAPRSRGNVWWLLVAWGTVNVTDSMPVMLLALGVVLPLWLYATVYGATLSLACWRLIIYLREYRRGRDDASQVLVGEPAALDPGPSPGGSGVPGAGL